MDAFAPLMCMGGMVVLTSAAFMWTLSMVVAACLSAECVHQPNDGRTKQPPQPPQPQRPAAQQQQQTVLRRTGFVYDATARHVARITSACRDVADSHIAPLLQKHRKMLVAWLVGISCIRLAMHLLVMFNCLPVSLWFQSTAMYFVYDIWSYSVYVLRKRFSNPAIVWGLGMVALAYDATFAQVDMHRSYISNIVDMLSKIEQESAALEKATMTLFRWIRTVLAAVKP